MSPAARLTQPGVELEEIGSTKPGDGEEAVDDDGVRIHDAALGRRGPLVALLRGFPDFWYTWHDHMAALSRGYRMVALDQRGYDLGDKPAGLAAYDIGTLTGKANSRKQSPSPAGTTFASEPTGVC